MPNSPTIARSAPPVRGPAFATADDPLRTLIARWRDDPGATYRTWFLWEERVKNFRSICRGLQAVVREIAAGTFGNAYRGSSLETVVHSVAEQRQLFKGADHAWLWKPKLRIPDIYESPENQRAFGRFLDACVCCSTEEQVLAAVRRLEAYGIKGLGPTAANLLYFLHPTLVPPFNTAMVEGYNTLHGRALPAVRRVGPAPGRDGPFRGGHAGGGRHRAAPRIAPRKRADRHVRPRSPRSLAARRPACEFGAPGFMVRILHGAIPAPRLPQPATASMLPGPSHSSASRRPRRAVRRLAAALAVALGIAAAAGSLSAHDFWLVPNAFAVAPGATLAVRGQTSTRFPTSLSAVVPDRVADARLLGASTEERIADLSVEGKSLMLRARPASAGQRVVAIALVPRTSRTTPQGLQRYLALEGVPALAERYAREGRFSGSDSLTQRTTKVAKTLVEVGRGGPHAFARAAGHTLEFVPLTDPAAARPGDTLAVRVLFRGGPLADAHLHAGAALADAPNDSAAAAGAAADITVVTDASGVARVPVARAGLWNVRTIHAAPAPGESLTWDVHFATLVFRIPGAPQ